MQSFWDWKTYASLLKESKLTLGLLCLMITGLLLLAWSLFSFATEGANLSNLKDIKWLLGDDNEKIEIIEKASRAGITIIDNSSDAGIKDIILLRGFERALTDLPPQIIDFINEKDKNHLTIIIHNTDVELADEPSVEWAAFYDWDLKIIHVKEELSNLGVYRIIFLHEIGHAYDQAYHTVFGKKDYYLPKWFWFINSTAKKEKPPTEYAETNYIEDFAITFALYFWEPDYLLKKFPLRYERMKNILSELTTKK